MLKVFLPLAALALAGCTTSTSLTDPAETTPPLAAPKTPEDAAIRQHRMGTLVVQTRPGAKVTVEQVRHEFWFGCALPNQAFDGRMPASDASRLKREFLANFNAAVTENALKWGSMEPQPGQVNYAVVDAILAWTDQHGLPLRGHNIYWGIDQFVQPWLKTMDDATLRQTLEKRGRDVGRRYRGRFVEYDLNNEMIHGNYYAQRLGKDITLHMANWVRAEDPSAQLFLNDYDITTGRKLEPYVAHIKELRAMGVPIAGLGVQGHLHAESFDRAALRNSLDVLAQFQLPIRITEFNLPGQRSKYYEKRDMPISAEEEAAKAKDIADYYRICFAHPAVEGVLMWGFWAGANWIPQSSLFKRDWTPTPALKAYRDLVYGEWWTQWRGKADAQGRCEIPAFFGTHQVTVNGKSQTVQLKKSAGRATVQM